MDPNALASSMDITTVNGFLNLVVTIAFFVVPFVLKRRRKRRKKAAETILSKDARFKMITETKDWLPAQARVTKLEFAKGEVAVTRKLLNSKKSTPNPLVAIVEFTPSGQASKTIGQVYMGEESAEAGNKLKILYNPLNLAEVIKA
jgi:hypothetical protein